MPHLPHRCSPFRSSPTCRTTCNGSARDRGECRCAEIATVMVVVVAAYIDRARLLELLLPTIRWLARHAGSISRLHCCGPYRLRCWQTPTQALLGAVGKPNAQAAPRYPAATLARKQGRVEVGMKVSRHELDAAVASSTTATQRKLHGEGAVKSRTSGVCTST